MNTLYMVLFFAVFPIFSTLSFPVACIALTWLAEPAYISPAECTALIALFALVTFQIPAGFLRVSCTYRMLSAFDLVKRLTFIVRNFRAYAWAWLASGLMSLFELAGAIAGRPALQTPRKRAVDRRGRPACSPIGPPLVLGSDSPMNR